MHTKGSSDRKCLPCCAGNLWISNETSDNRFLCFSIACSSADRCVLNWKMIKSAQTYNLYNTTENITTLTSIINV